VIDADVVPRSGGNCDLITFNNDECRHGVTILESYVEKMRIALLKGRRTGGCFCRGVGRSERLGFAQLDRGWELLRGRPRKACAVTSFEDSNDKKRKVLSVLFPDEDKPSMCITAHLLSSWLRPADAFCVVSVHVTVIADLRDPIRGPGSRCTKSSNGHNSFDELVGTQVVLEIWVRL